MRILSFVDSQKMHYGHVIDTAELNFRCHEDGAFLYEFMVVEEQLPTAGPNLRLKIFNESWDAFSDFPEFFSLLARLGETVTLEELAQACVEVGIPNLTTLNRNDSLIPTETDGLRQRTLLTSWAD